MGNKLARTTQVSPSEYLLDLPSSFNLVLQEVLGSDRFFKTVLCRHDEGFLLVKVYFKRGEFVNLKEHERKLSDVRERLQDVEQSHVWPFQHWHETEKAAYLLRQYFFSNLHDRISTRPFLSTMEKKWIAFQLLHAVKQCHIRGVCHGDVKCENVVVTSWNWVYLTDFATFKPTYIPDDNPADFSFFFDAGGRRRCYLAPERFIDPSLGCVEAALKPSMDMFSLGCVIAELFLEGQALFDLSQLLAYRKNLYDPKPTLEKISDLGIRNMVLQMIHLTPEFRLTPDEYLSTWGYDVFPQYFFPSLHNLFSCLTELDTDARVAIIQGSLPEIRGDMIRDAKTKATSDEVPDKGGGKSFSQGSENRVSSGKVSQKKVPSTPGGSLQDLVNHVTLLLKEDTVPRQCTRSQSNENLPRSSSDITCSCRVKAAALIMSEAASMQEVATDEVYENNLREPNGTFGDRTVYTTECLDYFKVTGSTRRKEEIPLPPDEGWVLETDWEIDYGWWPVDSDGWRYCKYDASGENAEGGKKDRLWPSGWSSTCTTECLWRQRRWTRRRRKTYWLPFLLECNRDFRCSEKGKSQAEVRSEGMVLIASVLCSCLRHVRRPHARRTALQLLNDAATLCDDDARLQRIVPFVAALLPDTASIVRCAALQTLCNVLSMVQSFSQSDAKVFPEYIFPLLSMLPDDQEESVRICYANCIDKFASTARRFLDLQYTGLTDGTSRDRGLSTKYEMELTQLRETIARVIHDLVMGPKQTPTIRRALLLNIKSLCNFFGKKHCNDFLLPVLPAFLNDRDKQLRTVFFEQIVHVAVFVGPVSLQEYLLPYLEQALSNVEETVVVNALECLAALCIKRMLRKRTLLKTVELASPTLCHPSQWVRRAAITLIAASASNFDLADVYAYLLPVLSPFLKREPVSLSSEADLVACLKEPLTREVFQRFLSDVMNPATRQASGVSLEYGGVKAWPKLGRSSRQRQQPPEPEDGEKMRAMEGYIRNLSSTMHSWDMENPDKLGRPSTPAGLVAGEDVPTDGIPLYSLVVSDKKLDTEDWNRVFPLDALMASQWASLPTDSVATDVLQKSTFRLATGSVYGGHRKGYDPQRTNETFSGPAVSILSNKSKPWPPLEGPTLNRGSATESSAEQLSDAYGKFLKSAAAEVSWKPRGVLVAHLQEHQRAVNTLAVADEDFFASGSDDGVVRIWDCRRLERDTSFKSRLRYSFERGRVLRLAMLGPDYQVAAASSSGEIHVFCVDYTPRAGNTSERYSGTSNVKKVDSGEGAILSLQPFALSPSGPTMLLYSTQQNGIHLWDFRSTGDAWLLKAKTVEGYVSGVAVDPARNWLVSGTSRGFLTLWDLRFQVPVFSWQVPSGQSVDAISVPSRTSLSRPFVYVAAGWNELALWNAENGYCQQVLRFGNYEEASLPAALNKKPSSQQPADGSKEYRVHELNDPPLRPPGVRSLLACSGGAAVIMGSTDCRIRLWDHTRPESSYCVCGPTVKRSAQSFVCRKVCGVSVNQEVSTGARSSLSGPALASLDPAGCHRDSVTSLATVGQRLLISSSRDGVIKVWK